MNWTLSNIRKPETGPGAGYSPDPLVGPGGRPIANLPPSSLLEKPADWSEAGTAEEFGEDGQGEWDKSPEYRARKLEYEKLVEEAERRWDHAYQEFDERRDARFFAGLTRRGIARGLARRRAEIQRWARREALRDARDQEIRQAVATVTQEITARWQPQIDAAMQGASHE